MMPWEGGKKREGGKGKSPIALFSTFFGENERESCFLTISGSGRRKGKNGKGGGRFGKKETTNRLP